MNRGISFRFKINRNHLIKDNEKYLFHLTYKFLFSAIICLIISAISFFFSAISMFHTIFELFLINSILLFGYFIYSYFTKLNGLKNHYKEFFLTDGTLIIYTNRLVINFNTLYKEVLLYSRMRKLLIIDDVLFILFADKNLWPIKINYQEVEDPTFFKLFFEQARKHDIQVKGSLDSNTNQN